MGVEWARDKRIHRDPTKAVAKWYPLKKGRLGRLKVGWMWNRPIEDHLLKKEPVENHGV